LKIRLWTEVSHKEIKKPMEKVSTKSKDEMKPHIFKVIVEPGEDRWFAYCPVLEDKGAATWGYTKEEALKNIREVLEMTIESMIEHGEPMGILKG
jgi:predicted RNase H-like HicB family nuclease